MTKTAPQQVAGFFGVPVENVKRQFAKNAAGFRVMAEKAAKAKNGKCNNYTHAQLVQMAEEAEAKSK